MGGTWAKAQLFIRIGLKQRSPGVTAFDQRCHRYCWIKFPALKDNYEAKSPNGNLLRPPLYFQIASCDVWNADQYGAVRVNQTEEPIIRWIGASSWWADLIYPGHTTQPSNKLQKNKQRTNTNTFSSWSAIHLSALCRLLEKITFKSLWNLLLHTRC